MKSIVGLVKILVTTQVNRKERKELKEKGWTLNFNLKFSLRSLRSLRLIRHLRKGSE
jgi:hypothetical protein